MDPELRKQAEANGITKKDFAEFMLKEIDLDKLAQEMGMKRTDAVKLLKAFFNDDIDTIWVLFPQAEKQGLIQQAGSEANAKAMFKQMLPEVRKEMTKQFEKECKLVKRNGKWYISGDKMLNKSPKKPAVKKPAVKQSTKEEAAESFCTAVANGDGNTVWELVSPAEKREMIEEMGSEAAAKAAFAKEFSPDAEGQAMLKDPAQRSIFINMMKSAVDGNNAWVKSNGKWYINFGKLK